MDSHWSQFPGEGPGRDRYHAINGPQTIHQEEMLLSEGEKKSPSLRLFHEFGRTLEMATNEE